MEISIKKDGKEVGSITFDMNELGHELCMGIRHGLYGVNADENADISDALYAISESIDTLAKTAAGFF